MPVDKNMPTGPGFFTVHEYIQPPVNKTMDAKTLTALKESIAHWRMNSIAIERHGARVNTASCALCRIYHENYTDGKEHSCAGCPIYKKTGETFCRQTPYRAAANAFNLWNSLGRYSERYDEYRDKFRAASKIMVEYLEALLPEEENSGA